MIADTGGLEERDRGRIQAVRSPCSAVAGSRGVRDLLDEACGAGRVMPVAPVQSAGQSRWAAAGSLVYPCRVAHPTAWARLATSILR